MSDAAAFVERAWRDGIGPDDRRELAALAKVDDVELRLFACWFDLLVEIAAEVPPPPPTPSGAVVHAAAQLARARITRDIARMEAAIDALAAALEHLADDEPHAMAARAWADLALGDVALMTKDSAAMMRRFEAVSAVGRPIALRVIAMLRLVGTAMSRVDPGPARKWARRALTLAESHGRTAHAARARVLLGLIDFVQGNVDAARTTMTPLLEDPESGILARLVLASVESAPNAMALFAEGIRRATEQHDVTAYLMCILIGSRRYVALGRRADALVTISAGIVELRKLAPGLATVLEDERVQWRESWGADAWAAAEAEALAGL